MTVSTYVRPNFTTQLGAAYKGNINAKARVFERFALWFAPHEQTVGSPAPSMTVRVEPGFIWDGATLSEKAAQTVEGFTIPAGGEHRIDRVVIDVATGDARRIAGTPASGSPSAVAPAVPLGSIPCCAVLITSADTAIANSMITDERRFKIPTTGGASFDGTNDYMTRGAGLNGAADSKAGTVSVWIKADAIDSSDVILQSTTTVGGTTTRFTVRWFGADQQLQVQAQNVSTGAVRLSLLSTSSYPVNGRYLHLLASWDLGITTAHMYINDVDDRGTSTILNDTIDWTVADWGVGARPDGALKFQGAIAEPYLKMGSYIDLSVESNRRKFITASKRPVNLGSDGSLPGLGVPELYLHLIPGEDAANFATNRGGGGNFTITGALEKVQGP